MSKLIVSYSVTDALAHDSQEIVARVDAKDKSLYGDSAYAGKESHTQTREQ